MIDKATYVGRNILITGGLGLTGSNLVGHLIEFGAKVTSFDSLIPESGANLFDIENKAPLPLSLILVEQQEEDISN